MRFGHPVQTSGRPFLHSCTPQFLPVLRNLNGRVMISYQVFFPIIVRIKIQYACHDSMLTCPSRYKWTLTCCPVPGWQAHPCTTIVSPTKIARLRSPSTFALFPRDSCFSARLLSALALKTTAAKQQRPATLHMAISDG